MAHFSELIKERFAALAGTVTMGGTAGAPESNQEKLWHWTLLFVFALFFLHIYISYPTLPRLDGVDGWEGWWDQSNYIGSARALAAGDLSPEQHWYPVGYAMLGAPFAWAGLRDPFLFVNLGFFLVFVHCFVRYFRPVIGAPLAAAIMAISLILPFRVYAPFVIEQPLLLQFVVPWNTNPVAALYLAIFLTLRAIGHDDRKGLDLALGAFAAGIFALRFVEAIPLLVPGAIYAYQRIWLQRGWLNAAYAASGAALVLLPFILLTFMIHGGPGSGYLAQSSMIGLSLSDIHERAVAIFIDAAPQFNEPETDLFGLHPWLVICVPFAAVWAVLDWRNGLAPVVTAALATVVYLSYNDFSPLNIFRYFLVHYIIWVLPVFAAAGVAGVYVMFKRREWRMLAGALPVAAFFVLVRPTLVPLEVTSASISRDAATDQITYRFSLGGSREVDAVDLIGASAPDWAALTLSEVVIRVDGGPPLKLFRDYRMFPAGSGIRILMNSHIRGRHVELTVGDAMTGRPEVPENITVSQLRLRLGEAQTVPP